MNSCAAPAHYEHIFVNGSREILPLFVLCFAHTYRSIPPVSRRKTLTAFRGPQRRIDVLMRKMRRFRAFVRLSRKPKKNGSARVVINQ